MRLALREEMQEIDQRAATEYGLSADKMMEKAGSLMLDRLLGIYGFNPSRRIGIICGPGHNGGDGLVVARKLFEKGFSRSEVWVLASLKTSVLFELNLRRFKEIGGSVRLLDASTLDKFDFNKYEIFIDALFGTGLSRPLDSTICRFIEKMNHHDIIALDVPSGLDANRGIPWGAAVRAVRTLTCGLAKPGFYLQVGPACTGPIEILNLGFPKKLIEEGAHSTYLIGKKSAQKILPPRRLTANKSHFGKLLILAGSAGIKGAAFLASDAAARMGVGYVTVGSPDGKILKKLAPDFLQTEWRDLSQLDFEKYSAVAIGPGLGLGKTTLDLLQKLKSKKIKKVLLDADAITVAAQNKIWPLPSTWLLTPHAGELSRITGQKALEIESDRLSAVKLAQKITGAQVLLKGFHSVLCSGEKSYIIASGNVALAKAGTGDVLTGFVSSLMAQGLPTDQAAALGAYLHGRIADLWILRGGSPRTLMASDLPKLLNYVLRGIE